MDRILAWLGEPPSAGWPLAASIVLGAYLAGSVLFAQVIARRAGVDLTRAGSGNPGATNTRRLLGEKAGRAVLALDMLKGLLPTLAARLVFGALSPITAAAGVAAVLGHLLPVWFRFRGGKGAATSAGVLLAVDPLAGVVAAAAYFGLKRLTGRVSVGSIGSALVAAATMNALHGATPPGVMGTVLAALIIVRHESNIRRLFAGTEPRS